MVPARAGTDSACPGAFYEVVMFVPGQRVRCIAASDHGGVPTGLVEGQAYTVDTAWQTGVFYVHIRETGRGMYPCRFEAVGREVDASDASNVGTFPFLNPGLGRV